MPEKPAVHTTNHLNRAQLNEVAIQIEFTVISMVQAFVLGALVTAATEPIVQADYQYWPYIVSGLLLIMFFWSQAIGHALTIVNWPFDLFHNTLYFLMAFIQMLAFSQLTHPGNWFLFHTAFFFIGWIVYFYDLGLVKRRAADYTTSVGKELYRIIIAEQNLGIRVLAPAGLLYSLLAWYLVTYYGMSHVWLAVGQVIIGIISIIYTLRSFRTRADLLVRLGEAAT